MVKRTLAEIEEEVAAMGLGGQSSQKMMKPNNVEAEIDVVERLEKRIENMNGAIVQLMAAIAELNAKIDKLTVVTDPISNDFKLVKGPCTQDEIQDLLSHAPETAP